MKYPVILTLVLFYLFSYQSTTFAAGNAAAGGHSVYDAIQQGKVNQSSKTASKSTVKSVSKTASSKEAKPAEVVGNSSPSLFLLLLKFIGSFVLVIGLLFGLLRFLSKKNRLVQPNGPILSLGGHMLGNNRSMQVVLIGQTIYIVGVGDSVTLIKEIPKGDEYQHLLESYENQGEARTFKWPQTDNLKWNTIFRKHMNKIQQEMGEEQQP